MFNFSRAKSFASFDGLKLSYTEYGDGRPVILLHGFIIDSKVNWHGFRPAFKKTGRRVVALDARGHGRSEKPHDSPSYADRAMAKDVSALVDYLGFDEVDLVGCSMGGFTAVEAALRDDRIKRIALLGVGLEDVPTKVFREDGDGLIEDNPAEPSFFRSLADDFGADRLALAAWLHGAVLPQVVVDDLPQIDTPVLVVNGKDDFHDGEEFVSHTKQGKAIIVPGDHVSSLESLELVRALVDFLQG